MTIPILLVDDHQMMREGLAALLREQPDIDLLAQACDGREALALVKELHPRVVVMDITMPGMNGVEATRQILAARPDTRVIGLSIHGERHFVAEMFKAGAVGYLMKMGAFEELVNAVRAVDAGQTYLSPSVAGEVMKDYAGRLPAGEVSALDVLSEREREVLQLLAEGKTSKEIGHALHVSSKTIDTHRRQIMEKLNLHSLPELTKFAIREGLTPLGS